MKAEIEPIDIHDYKARHDAGLLWYNGTFERDESVWTKTEKEKEALKKARRGNYPEFASSWTFTKHPIPCYGKVIIQLNVSGKDNKHFLEKNGYNPSHTTISTSCGQSDLPRLMRQFLVDKIDKDGHNHHICLVKKYKWNGKWYRPNEFPTYYW